MAKLQKMNHVTHLTNNIPATVQFYTEVLGMKLVAAERRPLRPGDLTAYPDTKIESLDESGFGEQLTIMFEMLDGSRVAFVEVEGLTSWPSNPLPRWIKHMAMKVEREEDLHKAKATLQERGIGVIGPVNHGLFLSIYFFDPVNDVRLEYAYNVGTLDEEDGRLAWAALETWKAGAVPQNRAIY